MFFGKTKRIKELETEASNLSFENRCLDKIIASLEDKIARLEALNRYNTSQPTTILRPQVETLTATVNYYHELQLRGAIEGALASMVNRLGMSDDFFQVVNSYDETTHTYTVEISLRVVSNQEAKKCNI